MGRHRAYLMRDCFIAISNRKHERPHYDLRRGQQLELLGKVIFEEELQPD